MKKLSVEKRPIRSISGAVDSLTLLSISPFEEDRNILQSIVSHTSWDLLEASDLESAAPILARHEIAVVLCDRELPRQNWMDAVDYVRSLPNAPSVIVASRLADERLWAEALNLGAWDVLAKPFDPREVSRSVKSAWQHWYNRRYTIVANMAAAS